MFSVSKDMERIFIAYKFFFFLTVFDRKFGQPDPGPVLKKDIYSV